MSNRRTFEVIQQKLEAEYEEFFQEYQSCTPESQARQALQLAIYTRLRNCLQTHDDNVINSGVFSESSDITLADMYARIIQDNDDLLYTMVFRQFEAAFGCTATVDALECQRCFAPEDASILADEGGFSNA